MKALRLLLASLGLLASCSTPAPRPFTPHPLTNEPGKLTVESDPPGALIQLNGKVIGQAPIVFSIPVTMANDKWIMKESVTVAALASENGEYTQTKYFERWSPAPQSIGFSMLRKGDPSDHADYDMQR